MVVVDCAAHHHDGLLCCVVLVLCWRCVGRLPVPCVASETLRRGTDEVAADQRRKMQLNEEAKGGGPRASRAMLELARSVVTQDDNLVSKINLVRTVTAWGRGVW